MINVSTNLIAQKVNMTNTVPVKSQTVQPSEIKPQSASN